MEKERVELDGKVAGGSADERQQPEAVEMEQDSLVLPPGEQVEPESKRYVE